MNNAHLVRLAGKRPIDKWSTVRPTDAAARAHLASGGALGIVPASLGLLVLDVDAGDYRAVMAQATPVAVLKTPRGHHLVYHRPPSYHGGNARWSVAGAAGDLRCARGYVRMWDPEAWRSLKLDGPRRYPPRAALPARKAPRRRRTAPTCITALVQASLDASGASPHIEARVANYLES